MKVFFIILCICVIYYFYFKIVTKNTTKRNSLQNSPNPNDSHKISCSACGRKHERDVLTCDCGYDFKYDSWPKLIIYYLKKLQNLQFRKIIQELKKFFFRPIPATILLILLIIFIVYFSDLYKKRTLEAQQIEIKTQQEGNRINSLYSNTLIHLNKYEFNEATSLLSDFETLKPKYKENFVTYNLAINLKEQISFYLLNQNMDKVKDVLQSLSDSEYNKLCSSQLTNVYFEPKQINDHFISILYKNRALRHELLEQQKIQKAKEARKRALKEQQEAYAAEQALSAIRKMYQQTLRNNFLDSGLDIKVQVTGKNNTQLILTYIFFNDVWFRKFETSGDFSSWHELGFNRIDVKDGSDYHRYCYW